jgi:hypothetical protein
MRPVQAHPPGIAPGGQERAHVHTHWQTCPVGTEAPADGAKARAFIADESARLASCMNSWRVVQSRERRSTAQAAEIPERVLIAAGDALGVRTRRGQWWLPG